MNEWSANNSGRTGQVWQRLVGCYGESLIRKFGEEPPPEWNSAIAELNDYQLKQGMRRLKYSGKPHPPSLPEFVRLCRQIGHSDDVADSPPVHRHPALTHQSAEPDRWLIAGNRRLMRYVFTRIAENSKCFGRPASIEALRDPLRADDKVLDASPAFVHNVKTLVAYKNRWVEVMQETATAEGVPVDDQNMFWQQCIRDAEALFQREQQ